LDKKDIDSNNGYDSEKVDLAANMSNKSLNSYNNSKDNSNAKENQSSGNLHTSIIDFPVSILKTELSSLEAIVKYLRENKKLSYKEIAKLLKRDPKTLAVSCAVAERKKSEKFSKYICADKKKIPFSIFDEKLSILESICSYLRSQGLSFSEISRLIAKDPRTIWTVCKRAEQKMKQGETL
jgi:DNA-binding CsgD family transcriptional regulator